MSVISDDIELAKEFLEDGELVAIPTETVYGLAGCAFNDEALKLIFQTKNRPFYDPLILHTNSPGRLSEWGLVIPEQLQPLTEAFWPGPLTVLVDRSPKISNMVTSGLERVAIRIPDHELTRSLLSIIDFPVAAPSANPFGYVSPTQTSHVLEHFQDVIPMILDGGPCSLGIESTIVGVDDGQITVYRLGGIALESITALVGEVAVKTSSSQPAAPGMLDRHYAPDKRITIIHDQEELDKAINASERPGLISFTLGSSKLDSKQVFVLSDKHDLKEAASKFYLALRTLGEDEAITNILVERLPDLELGRAINDRLMRAAAHEDA